MIDTLMANRRKAQSADILTRMQLEPKKFGLITLHRPSNVDDMDVFGQIISAFEVIEKDMKLVFPIHPRTRKNIKGTDIGKRAEAMNNLFLFDPIGYLDFLCLMSNSALVITDSGGIQEETTILGVPCMTLRENTERPVTITEGTNRLVQLKTKDILKNYEQIKDQDFDVGGRIPRFWDGKAAERITGIIAETSESK